MKYYSGTINYKKFRPLEIYWRKFLNYRGYNIDDRAKAGVIAKYLHEYYYGEKKKFGNKAGLNFLLNERWKPVGRKSFKERQKEFKMKQKKTLP